MRELARARVATAKAEHSSGRRGDVRAPARALARSFTTRLLVLAALAAAVAAAVAANRRAQARDQLGQARDGKRASGAQNCNIWLARDGDGCHGRHSRTTASRRDNARYKRRAADRERARALINAKCAARCGAWWPSPRQCRLRGALATARRCWRPSALVAADASRRQARCNRFERVRARLPQWKVCPAGNHETDGDGDSRH